LAALLLKLVSLAVLARRPTDRIFCIKLLRQGKVQENKGQ
jgi:hypothetical protein